MRVPSSTVVQPLIGPHWVAKDVVSSNFWHCSNWAHVWPNTTAARNPNRTRKEPAQMAAARTTVLTLT